MTASHNKQDWKSINTDEYNENEQDWEHVKTDEYKQSYEYNARDSKIVSFNNTVADLGQFCTKLKERDSRTAFFNNTVAGLDQSWREFKEQTHGTIYDIGTWLAKTYKNYTEKATYNLNAQVERVQQVEEIEMTEFSPLKTKVDCTLPEEEINEKPGGQIHNANITNLWNLIGRVLG
ncbi:hypothetical protein [Wolbachia endosymbiont of Folsomia candida]|uniref:hypothetical protein n=1 Tax=Wolbachia endosymbiont of Folsomia candida TaxID=169402 RepID=UPI000AE79B19|nr:hypothetical protein [Wolbachia endosymbiont of Folsomia candida]APR98890.1 hypothetical protein ASM33_06760 [Wolbachia endosymbiont of Folsomia candida]